MSARRRPRAASSCSRDRATASPLSSDQSWRKISTAPRVMSGVPPNSVTRSSSAAPSIVGDRKRDARRRPAAGELLHDLEHPPLRRVLAAERVASADARRARAPRSVPPRHRRRTRTTSGSRARRGPAACARDDRAISRPTRLPSVNDARPVDDARDRRGRAARRRAPLRRQRDRRRPSSAGSRWPRSARSRPRGGSATNDDV